MGLSSLILISSHWPISSQAQLNTPTMINAQARKTGRLKAGRICIFFPSKTQAFNEKTQKDWAPEEKDGEKITFLLCLKKTAELVLLRLWNSRGKYWAGKYWKLFIEISWFLRGGPDSTYQLSGHYTSGKACDIELRSQILGKIYHFDQYIIQLRWNHHHLWIVETME